MNFTALYTIKKGLYFPVNYLSYYLKKLFPNTDVESLKMQALFFCVIVQNPVDSCSLEKYLAWNISSRISYLYVMETLLPFHTFI